MTIDYPGNRFNFWPGEALLVMVKILLGFVSLLLFSFSDGFDLEVHLGSLNACLVLESSLLCLLKLQFRINVT